MLRMIKGASDKGVFGARHFHSMRVGYKGDTYFCNILKITLYRVFRQDSPTKVKFTLSAHMNALQVG